MNNTLKYMLLGTVFGLGLSVSAAQATEGYFTNGTGARNKAMAGAGVADGKDASALALNPAALADLGNEVAVSGSLFNPIHSATIDGTQNDSRKNAFVIPNIAINFHLGNALVDSVGFSISANGGMNTDYGPGATSAAGGTSGIFDDGPAGIDLQQMLIAVGFAKRYGDVSIGLAPTLVRQQFSVRGVANFDNISSIGDVGNGEESTSWGYGLRGGIQYDVSPVLRVAFAGATKMYMEEFENHKGFFAEQGDFDIPANLQVGLSYDVSSALTISADYKRIFYGDVKAVNNASNPTTGFNLGADNGAGFGWESISIVKIGLEYDYSADWILRAGYAWNEVPLDASKDAQFNVLAPAVSEHHITAGFEKKNFMMPGLALEVAGMFSPNNKESGPSLAAFSGGTPVNIDLEMYQYELTAGLKWKF